MINDSMSRKELPKLSRSEMVIITERIANKLVDKYNAPASRQFFLKAAWHLSEDFIWTVVEISRSKKYPIKYFIKSCKNEMAR